MKRRDVLESIAYAEGDYGSLVTGGPVRRRDVLRAVERGLAQSVGLVRVLDDDGHPSEPERFREGFRLTEAGRRGI
jgi:hypothetical protein